MGKAIFENKNYYYFLILFLILLLSNNVYKIFVEFDFGLLLPIALQIFILTLVLLHHFFTKIVLKIWSSIFLIIAYLMQIIGKILKDISVDFQEFDVKTYLFSVLMLLLGIIIFFYSQDTITIKKEE